MAALGLEALAERLEVAGRARPALLDRLRGDLAVWRHLEPSNGAGPGDDGQDAGMSPLLLTYHEAAAATRLSVPTIERAVRDGRLRVSRYGRAVRIRPEDLKEFVDGLPSAEGKGKT